VGVEHLRDKPYDSTQDELKATILEVVTTMKDLMRLNPLYKEHIQMFVQHMGEFNASKLADFGAALTTADEPLLQEVLEELDVLRRLHLTLVLLKKELELSKLQQSIAKGVEEKMTGDQRKYFLMEQLKAIKKVTLIFSYPTLTYLCWASLLICFFIMNFLQ
jgi:Lon-like ATP-dependent protease